MISPAFILCMLLITQEVQGWWHPSGYNYGYGFYPHPWYHPIPVYHPPVYQFHAPYIHHFGYGRGASKGAQIGAAIGFLAGSLGKKK